jgi:flagellin
MALNIQTNIASLSAQINVQRNQNQLMASFQKLSSGYRVNSAADDAAGLAISESMKAQVRSYTVAQRNAADGISMAQTAEGALGEIHDVLGRMRELGMQAANGSLTSTDRLSVSKEFTSLQAEITRIQGSTKFNGSTLIDKGTGTAVSINFQVGLGNDISGADQIGVGFSGIDLDTVTGGGTLVTGSDGTNAVAALAAIDTAISTVSDARSGFGAAMNRLTVATNNIQTMSLNLSAANSRIRDVDVAAETANMARNQVLTQAGVSVLAQANQIPQLAFGLIGK